MSSPEVTRIECGSENCYIVKEGTAAVLVDTCSEKARERVADAARSFGVRAIVLTHGHFDHCQNAAFIAAELDIPILMHEADIALARDNTVQLMHARTFLGHVLRAKSAREFRTYAIEPFEVARTLSDGDSLEDLGISARVIGLPGHTAGSIGIDVGAAGVIVGDELIAIPSARKAMIYFDEEQMERSAERIAALGERTIWYGHGNPTGNWLAKRGQS